MRRGVVCLVLHFLKTQQDQKVNRQKTRIIARFDICLIHLEKLLKKSANLKPSPLPLPTLFKYCVFSSGKEPSGGT